MTDRDHFAAAALTGLLARPDVDADPLEHRFLCEDAWRWADAMLRERGLTTHDAAPATKAHVDAAGISRQGTGDTPDSQPTRAQGSVRGECTERDPCPYVTGTVTRYCTLTPFTLTDAEREAVESAIWDYEQNDDDDGCARMVATLRGLLERMGGGE